MVLRENDIVDVMQTKELRDRADLQSLLGGRWI